MPELPEAESIVRTLNPRLRGATMTRVLLARVDIVHSRSSVRDPLPSTGRRVREVLREGKRVIVVFDDGARLVVALGMTGRLTVEPAGRPPEPHTHVRIVLDESGMELRFRDPRRFGGVWFFDVSKPGVDSNPLLRRESGGRVRTLSPLGVDPLTVALPAMRGLLQRKRQIKALLMDQRAVAGLGNIYCDEALHRAGIHPLRRADRLTAPESAKLLRSIRNVLNEAIRFNGSTLMDYRNADGAPGSFQQRHRVYNRTDKPCRNCRAPIARILAAGRSTHYCPICQPA